MGLRLDLNARLAGVAEVQFFWVGLGAKQGLCKEFGESPFSDTIWANEQKGASKFIIGKGIGEPLALTLMTKEICPVHYLLTDSKYDGVLSLRIVLVQLPRKLISESLRVFSLSSRSKRSLPGFRCPMGAVGGKDC